MGILAKIKKILTQVCEILLCENWLEFVMLQDEEPPEAFIIYVREEDLP